MWPSSSPQSSTSHLPLEERVTEVEKSVRDVQNQQRLLMENIYHIYNMFEENTAVVERMEHLLQQNTDFYTPY